MNNWRAKALKAVEEAEKKRAPQVTHWGAQYHIRVTTQFRALMKKAAESRGISMSGYVRRALAKQIAADLGLSWLEVLSFTPHPPAFGMKLPEPEHLIIVKRQRRDGRVMHSQECAPDDGTGFGDWT